ncbi:Lrp/AsnC family transcriptional regulator [Paenarthrobacter sp. YJN-5]|uniref:Lrp/AsnC family transcriptional regulator n=1 Tax=Paenarthrobacter sp. YJN-5 TaxID=2735316 RepID=UPI001877E7EB|nr:Lrp/AsnC family transcriptional regulator [Paenarthrobacter sp. YJN-5]QOT19832.1 Lrp/AsnC family transcriptional regulator [Paenarthrobacter sp. YJN-5]
MSPNATPLSTDLDRKILACLALDARASWAQISSSLGVAESTVSRHFQRLEEQGYIHITGMLDPQRCGLGNSYWIFLRALPGKAAALSLDLAKHPETRLVVRLSGGYDVLTEVVVPDREELVTFLDSPPLRGQISEASSIAVMRNFKAGWEWAADLLTPRELHLMRPIRPLPADARGTVDLDQLDLELLTILAHDGRATNVSLASRVHVDETTVSRRINRMRRLGAVVFSPQLDPRSLGFGVEAFVRLSVSPAEITSTARTLAGLHAVRYVSVTTGDADLFCEIVVTSIDEYYSFITNTLSGIPGVQSSASSLSLQTLKRASHPWLKENATSESL